MPSTRARQASEEASRWDELAAEHDQHVHSIRQLVMRDWRAAEAFAGPAAAASDCPQASRLRPLADRGASGHLSGWRRRRRCRQRRTEPLASWTTSSASAARASTICKGIDVDIPRHRLVVITGLSGSGKSSLAFDTIYAEGQRRYVESLSAYARQFLELMQKPDVDLDHRPVAGDLDRAEDHLEEPALDRRHGHRDLRLHAPALGAGRHPLLAGHRPADRGADRLADGRPASWPCPRARGSTCWRRSCAAARASTARSSPSCCAQGFQRVKVDGELYELDEVPGARQEAQARDRGRGRPGGDWRPDLAQRLAESRSRRRWAWPTGW